MAIDNAERLAQLRLSRTEHVGAVTFRQLLRQFGTAAAALKALPDLSKRGGRSKPLQPAPIGDAEKIMAALEAFGGKLLSCSDEDYPALLRTCDDAPPLLFAAGHIALLQKPSVAIVGARNASLNGQRFTTQLAQGLGRAGYAVVSGLARGIDTAAHSATLDTGTIAVIGCGLDVCYPKENTALQEKISREGLLLSEYAPGTPPAAAQFPRRNRIIAGHAAALAVVEASLQSGSLITARLANEYGREVFAVPGSPMDARAQGTNRLLKQGAHVLENAGDIVEVLQRIPRPLLEKSSVYEIGAPPQAITEELARAVRARLPDLLSASPLPMESLLEQLDAPPAVVHLVLLELELAGRLERHPGGGLNLLY